MNVRLKTLVMTLSAAGLIVSPAFAETSTNDAQQIEKLATQTKMLLAQVDQLQQEVTYLKKQDTTHSVSTGITQGKPHRLATARVRARHDQPQVVSTTTAVQHPPITRSELARMAAQQADYLPFDLDVPGQAFVSTGPYVGVPIQYAGSNLIINSPSVNTDLQLLGIRKSIHDQLLAMGGELKEPYHSHLLLSGVLEGQANDTQVGGDRNNFSYIDVTNVSIDAMVLGPSNWLTGFIELSYDNGIAPTNFYTTGVTRRNMYRFSNARVFVNKAFITIGDLTRSPFYGTIGQMYVPFGRYSSVMISDPLTKVVGRTKARAILIGFSEQSPNAFYGSVYGFEGDSHSGGSGGSVNNGGLNLGYKYKAGHDGFFHGDIGGGVIANLADGAGMQLGNGFAYDEKLSHNVPGANLRGVFSFGDNIDIIAEWVTATTNFSRNDMMYNGHGAKPSAFDIEGAYSFYMYEFPSSVGLGWSKSYSAESLGIPLSRIYAVFNTSLFRNTLQSLEFRHDQNYAASDIANGPVGAQLFPGQCTAATCTQSGRSDNAITAQFDYYF